MPLEEGRTQRHTTEGQVKMEAENGVNAATSQGTPGPTRSSRKLTESSKGPPLELSENEWPCQHPHFRHLTPEL